MPFIKLPPVFYTKPTDPTFMLKYGDKIMQKVSVRIPDGKGTFPAIFTIHGGQWRKEYTSKQLEYLCEDLKQSGVITFNIEFRRVGHVGGGFPGTFEDLHNAINYVLKYCDRWKVDRNRLSILGHSSGAHLAFCLPHTLKPLEFTPKALIGLAGVYDVSKSSPKLQAIANEFFSEMPQMSPVHLRQDPKITQRVIVGERDKLVGQAMDYAKAQPHQTVFPDILRVVPKASHFTVVDPTAECWPFIRQEILSAAGVSTE